SVTVGVVATDPDQGDTVTLSATSAAPGIASVSLIGPQLTITGNSQGSTNITVTARDSRGLESSVVFLATVQNPQPQNSPPNAGAISAQTITVGATLDVPIAFSDPDNDPLNITAQSSNNSVVSAVVVNNNAVRLSGVAVGMGNITLTATDGRGGSATTTFAVAVNDPPPDNDPPTLQAINDQTVDVGQALQIALSASDPNGDNVILTAGSGDDFVAAVSVSGTSLNLLGVSAGQTQITVTASDGTDAVTEDFTVTVNPPANNPPVILSEFQQVEVDAGATVQVEVNTSDPEGDPVTVSAFSSDAGVASVNASGTPLIIEGLSGGQAEITVSATDGTSTVSDSFTVVVTEEVAQVNTPPSIDTQFAPQVLEVGQSVALDVSTSDAEGDPVTVSAQSTNPNVVTVNPQGTPLTLTAIGEGSAQIIVTASDGTDSTDAAIEVSVNAPPPNNPPDVAPIGQQNLTTGGSTTVDLNTSDPEGDPITVTEVTSSDPNVATASLNGNQVVINSVGAGTAQITVTVSDGVNTTQTTFTVGVEAPVNNPPNLEPAPEQSLQTGGTVTLNLAASDPEGDPVTFTSPNSGDANVATASLNGNQLTITAVGPGSTQIFVSGTDGTNTSEIAISVNVAAPANVAPSIDSNLGAVALEVGQSVNVDVIVSDPEGDPTGITASSSDPNVASVNPEGAPLVVTGVNPGNAQITVTASDGTDSVNATFDVAVNAPAQQVFDPRPFDEVPVVNFNALSGIYQAGINAGKQNTRFSTAGGGLISSGDFLPSPPYNTGGAQGLENLIGFYDQVEGEDSFERNSRATGGDWSINTLFDPNAVPECSGLAPLQCELEQYAPSVMIIAFSPNNALQTSPEEFNTRLQDVINTVVAAGTIPVLATIPPDPTGAISEAQIAPYNEIIVTKALDPNNNLPLWNAFVSVENTAPGVGGGGPADLTVDNAVNQYNQGALQTLEAVRNSLFP
ncbi:MAG: hypothetical protein HC915_09445, partial [Anaerolineae bacterium]|nr:hypothetical protein [Anaerolineae bacterium]